MEIIGTIIIQDTNVEAFHDAITKKINESQERDERVEIQYSTSSVGERIVYSALLVIRKHKVTI